MFLGASACPGPFEGVEDFGAGFAPYADEDLFGSLEGDRGGEPGAFVLLGGGWDHQVGAERMGGRRRRFVGLAGMKDTVVLDFQEFWDDLPGYDVVVCDRPRRFDW